MTVLKKLNSHFARYFSYFQFILYLSSCEALIAVLTTVWPIKALSNSVVLLSGLLFLVATVNCRELINKLHRILQSVTRFTPALNGKQESRVHSWVTSIFFKLPEAKCWLPQATGRCSHTALNINKFIDFENTF